MLRKSLGIVAGAALLTGLGTVVSQPSYAQSVQFYCAMGDLPTTMARRAGVEGGQVIPVIRWYSWYFANSGYDPRERCREVSARFQTAHNEGRLKNVTAGIVNNLPVICATTSGGRCDNENILFTLKPGEDAAERLEKLFDVRDYGGSYAATGGQGPGAPLYESGGRRYVDVTKLLAPLENSAGSETPAPRSGGEAQPTPATPNPGQAF